MLLDLFETRQWLVCESDDSESNSFVVRLSYCFDLKYGGLGVLRNSEDFQ